MLTHRNIQATKSIGIAPNRLLKWMKEQEFAAAYRDARRAAAGRSVAGLQQTTGAAVSTLQKPMVDASTPPTNVAKGILALVER